MATFDSTIHPLAFAHMEGGMKTVFVAPWNLELDMVTSGDRIEFDDIGSISVGMVRRYDSIAEMMEAEGYENVVPEADTVEDAMTLLQGSEGWDDKAVEDKGVIAFRVRWAKRKS